MEPVGGPVSRPLQEGDDVDVRFKLAYAAGGAPLEGAFPSGWIQRVGNQKPACHDVVARILNAGFTARPDVNLNNYYVLALNNDATITVVDPLFGYGGSKLLELVTLPSPGDDWALTPLGDHLFVTLPESGEVAVIKTTTWTIADRIKLRRPRRVAVQPDGAYVWVTLESDAAVDSQPDVVVLSAATLEVAARIRTGAGEHALAFSADNRWAAVTNTARGTVSLIDVQKLTKVRDFNVGREPLSVAFSTGSQMFYVADRLDGSILAIEPGAAREITRVQTGAGIVQITFAPGGRLGFIANPDKDLIQILDSSTNRIVQSATIKSAPDHVSFSSGIAYVRCRRSEIVWMIPLSGAGKEGGTIAAVDLQGAGQHAFGQVSRPSPADTFVRAPGENAMLLANPADKAIYYYQEGMPSVTGSFSNYSREPRAILVLNRTLKESAPGVFATTTRLPAPGNYDVALLLDSPRVVQCFPITVDANPALAATEARVAVEFPEIRGSVHAGEHLHLRVRIKDAATGAARSDLQDVRILAILEPGPWNYRELARREGDGVYGIDVLPPEAGRYRIAVESRSQGLSFRGSPQFILNVLPRR